MSERSRKSVSPTTSWSGSLYLMRFAANDQEVEPGVDDGELRLTVHALRALLIAWKGRGTVCGRRELSHEIAGRRLPGDIGFYIGR